MTPNTKFQKRCKKLVVFTFLAVFLAYYTLFWGRGTIFGVMTPNTKFEKRCQKLVVFTFLAVFVAYYTLFWVPGTIFGVDDTQY